MIKKYGPFFIPIVLLTVAFPREENISNEWLGLVILFIGIIILFELIERSRVKRTDKWKSNRPSKLVQMLKFSIFLGLPLSVIIIFIIHNKADLFFSILFISIPLIIIFGWIGILDWQSCEKHILEEKYNVTL